MINPHLACELRRAQRFFSKTAQPDLAGRCHTILGNMADTTIPEQHEADALELLHIAFGGTRIHA